MQKTTVVKGESSILIEAVSKEALEYVLSEASKWMAPASERDVYLELVRLQLVSVTAAETDEDFQTKLKLYWQSLQMYPGDIVLRAINASIGEFFPALKKIESIIKADRELERRNVVLRELNRTLKNWEIPKPTFKPVTREQTCKMDDLVRKYRSINSSS